MKHTLFVLLLSLTLASESFSQVKEVQVANAFKSIADTLSAFFQMDPKLLNKAETVTDSPTGIDVWVDMFALASSSYDVQKTESIISPYVGFVELKLLLRVTQDCGTSELPYINWKYWNNIAEAINYANADSCYGEARTYNVKFLYAFQESEWVFKKIVLADDGKEEFVISQAFGKQASRGRTISEPAGLEFNKRWFALAEQIKVVTLKSDKAKPK